jgi:hypothetical protein
LPIGLAGLPFFGICPRQRHLDAKLLTCYRAWTVIIGVAAMWAILVALLSAVCAAGAQAEEAGAARAEILWTGIYRADVVGFTPQPGTATGKTNKLANIERLETTTTVRTRLGVSFGFEFRLAGTPQDVEMPVRLVVLLPRAGLRNPATQQHFTREEWQPAPRRAGDAALVGYTLEHPWEMVPGLWTFEIWQSERKLGEQSFCLVGEGKPSDTAADDERCPSVPTT